MATTDTTCTTLQPILEQMATDAANINHACKYALTVMSEGNQDGAIGATLTVQREINRLQNRHSTLLELHAASYGSNRRAP